MSDNFKFQLHDEPVECPLEVLTSILPTTYFAMGIVNPMGPTLNVLASQGIKEPGGESKVYKVMLNPFSQSCHEVGTVQIGRRWTPPTDLAPFFRLDWGSCPTFLIPSALYDEGSAINVFSELLKTFDDGKETLAKVRKHVGDPWKRVEGEMDNAFTKLLRKISVKSKKSESGPLNSTEALEFAKLQMNHKNLLEEFKAFSYAWEGSINFTKMEGMGKDRFLELFSLFMMTSRTGFMRNIVDNPDLLNR